MPISPPIGPVFRALHWAFTYLTRALFSGTYRRSHELWAKRHRLGAHWNACGQHLEYSVYIAQATDPEPRISRIAFRSVNEDIDTLSVVFEADSDTARYQERIAMVNVNRKPIVWTMTNVPFQDFLQLHDHAGPRFSWDAYKISVVQLKLKGGRIVQPFDTLTSHLTHTWFLNSTWRHKWQRFWNLDAIHWAKKRLCEYWTFGFGMPATRRYGPNGYEATPVQRLMTSGTRPLAWLMASDWVVTIQFWAALWSGLYVLNDETELQWRWKKPEIGAEKLLETSPNE